MPIPTHNLLAAAMCAAVVSLSSPAMAGDQPPASKPKSGDAGEIVCEKQAVLGSRLQTKRVCMTRGQWADMRSADRREIEKAQTLVRVK